VVRRFPSRIVVPRRVCGLLVFCLLSSVLSCGKRGNPLPPLNIAPEAPQALTARRLGDLVYLQMKVPSKAVAGNGPFSVDHLEVYAVTLAPGANTPSNPEMLKPEHVIGQVDVRPPVDPDETPDPDSDTDTRPQPGETTTFVEKLTAAQLTPAVIVEKTAKKKKGPEGAAPAAAPGAAPAAAPPPGAMILTRLYMVQGVARNGSKGGVSTRVRVPLLAAPGPARAGNSAYDATSVTIAWNPPVSATDEIPGVLYNVYSAPAAPANSAGAAAVAAAANAPTPLNDKPLDATTFNHPGAEPGKEQCFVVRSVATVDTATIESDPSSPMCVTPKDTFPPAAPKGLAAVSGAGAINLIWDANTEPDVGGYVVLRGEAPGDTLQPLTPQPIRETRFRDGTVKPGVRYVYAVIAVDRATPPNRSPQSSKVEETAR
jgi:hypothetical protein